MAANHRDPVAWGTQPTRNILFLCTGNLARLMLAEALTNRMSTGGVRAYSAGGHPTEAVNSGAATWLSKHGYEPSASMSKSWHDFTAGPEINWVITFCDSATGESCHAFPGNANRVHWGLPDPAGGAVAFDEVAATLSSLIRHFLDSH
ncbi:MAG: arsenate reductase ArsC [Pseudomonadales bacterium]|nr:arsenate reductase ArsC [Pseudomonadales bacterium]